MKKKGPGYGIAFSFLLIISVYACSTTKPVKSNEGISYFPADKALYDTIAYQDSLFFNAFNNRDLEKLKSFLSGNLEIYQDNIGVRGYDQSVDAFKGLFAKDYILTRKLIKSSLEVYPIKNYGAIETGSHTFCHTENNKYECSTFKFVQIWEKQNGQWKLTRIITYDHKM